MDGLYASFILGNFGTFASIMFFVLIGFLALYLGFLYFYLIYCGKNPFSKNGVDNRHKRIILILVLGIFFSGLTAVFIPSKRELVTICVTNDIERYKDTIDVNKKVRDVLFVTNPKEEW